MNDATDTWLQEVTPPCVCDPVDCGPAPQCHEWACIDCVCAAVALTGPICDETSCDFSCVEGQCTEAPANCDDGIPCTVDFCDPGVGCQSEPECCECGEGDPQAICDDQDPCTLDYCSPSFECINLPVDCASDDGPCSYGACDPGSGACVVAWAETDGRDCEHEFCAEATCAQGTCDCSASPVETCQGQPNGTRCDDDNPCTADDLCSEGSCLGLPTYLLQANDTKAFSQVVSQILILPSGDVLMAGSVDNATAAQAQRVSAIDGVVWSKTLLTGSVYVSGMATAGSQTVVYAIDDLLVGQDLASGDPIWSVSGYDLPDLPGGHPEALTSLSQTSDIITTGGARLLARLDRHGGVVWTQELPQGSGSGVVEGPSGGVFVTGSIWHESDHRVFLSRWSSSGELRYFETLDLPFSAIAEDLVVVSDGALAIAGTESGVVLDRSFVSRVSSSGTHLSTSLFEPGSRYTRSPIQIAAAPNGGVWVKGYGDGGGYDRFALLDVAGDFRGERRLTESVYMFESERDGRVVLANNPTFEPEKRIWVTDNRLRTASPCDDGDACNGSEWCDPKNLTCEPGELPGCMDGSPCAPIDCDPLTGECRMSLIADGTLCLDPSTCGTQGTCDTGHCKLAKAPCDDGNPCTLDTCTTKKACQHETIWTESMPCQDGDRCTKPGTCKAGSCVAGEAMNCPTSMPCQTATCDPSTGCVIDWAACECQADSDCDDGDACNGEESCAEDGYCVAGVRPDCPLDGCGRLSCDADIGCIAPDFFSECSEPMRATTNAAFTVVDMALDFSNRLVGAADSGGCDLERALVAWDQAGQIQPHSVWQPSGRLRSVVAWDTHFFALEELEHVVRIWDFNKNGASEWDHTFEDSDGAWRLDVAGPHVGVLLAPGSGRAQVWVAERQSRTERGIIEFPYEGAEPFVVRADDFAMARDGGSALVVGRHEPNDGSSAGTLLWRVNLDVLASDVAVLGPSDGSKFSAAAQLENEDWIVRRRGHDQSEALFETIERYGEDLVLTNSWTASYSGRPIRIGELMALADGGYVATGYVGSSVLVSSGGWIARFDSSGDIVWDRLVGEGSRLWNSQIATDGRNLYWSMAAQMTTPSQHQVYPLHTLLVRLPMSGGEPGYPVLLPEVAPWLGPPD